MLIMDKENAELFHAERQRVINLGVTEEEYNDMIASAITWIGKMIALYDQSIYPVVVRNLTMRLVIGHSVAEALNRLKYYSRLLRDELWDTDDPKQFYQDQWDLLIVLKEDYVNAHQTS